MAGKKIIIITGLLIAVSIPLTLSLMRNQTNPDSRASAPDKLEVELGTPNSNAIKVPDNTASGGYYIRLDASQTVTPAPTSQPGSGGSDIVGSGVSLTSLSNTRIGYANITHGTYRFKAEKSLTIKSARIYLESGSCDGGYGLGDGGKYKWSILPDNGSGIPNLNVTSLASYTTPSAVGCSGKAGYLITFSSNSPLTAGKIYHLVTENIHPDPTNNYISINAVFVQGGNSNPYHPVTPNSEGAVYYKSGSSWTYRDGHLPIMDLEYSDGSHQGWGYMEISHVDHGGGPSIVGYIGGSNIVRERFTYSSPNKSVSSANIRVGRVSGSGTITIKLIEGSAIKAQISISGGSIPTISTNDLGISSQWFGGSFPPVTLVNGNSYAFEISAPNGSDYRMWPIRMGKSYGYHSDTYFNGILEYSTNGGSSWSSLGGNSSGQRPNEYDLQFYLE